MNSLMKLFNFKENIYYKKFFIRNSKDFLGNKCFVILSESLENSIDIINSNFINSRLIRASYLDKKYDDFYRQTVKTIINIDNIKLLRRNTNIIHYPVNVNLLKGKNFFYLVFNKLNAILKSKFLLSKTVKLEAFKLFIKNIVQTIPKKEYDGIYFILDNDTLLNNFSSTAAELNAGKNLHSILYLTLKELNLSKDLREDPREILFISYNSKNKNAFYFDIKDEKLNVLRINRLFNIQKKISENLALDIDELKEINTETENENNINTFSFTNSKDFITKNKWYLLEDNTNKSNINVGKGINLYNNLQSLIKEYLKNSELIVEGTKIITKENEPFTETKKFLKGIQLYEFIPKLDVNYDYLSIINKQTLVSSKPIELKYVDSLKIEGNGIILINFLFTLEPDKINIISEKVETYIENVKTKLGIYANNIPITEDEQIKFDNIYNTLINMIDNSDISNEEIDNIVNDNPELVKTFSKIVEKRHDEINNTRNNMLKSKLKTIQDNLEFNIEDEKLNIKAMLEDIEKKVIEPKEIKSKLLNEEINKTSTFGFTTNYTEKFFKQDMIKTFTSFSESPDLPLFVKSINVEDTSNHYTKKQTAEIEFNVQNGKPQKIKIDIPKVSKEGYLYINGARKKIMNQVIMLPIVKVKSNGEDCVQYSTNYTKMFISRSTGVLNQNTFSFRKWINNLNAENKLKATGYEIRLGNTLNTNAGYINSLEFDELSQYLVYLKVNKYMIRFSRDALKKELLEKQNIDTFEIYKNLPEDKEYFPIGYNTSSILWSDQAGKLYTSDFTGKKFSSSMFTSLTDFILSEFMNSDKEETKSAFYKFQFVKSDRKYSYSMVRVAGSRIPMILFLGFKDNLLSILEKYEIEYEFTTNKDPINKKMTNIIKFKDGNLFFGNESISKTLFINGLRNMNTEEYSIEEFNAKGEAYLEYFKDMGKPRYGKALGNFYSLFLDPITKEILKDMGIPNTFTESFFYCNDLLEYPGYKKKNDMSVYRIRNTELINALLYSLISRNIETYRNGVINERTLSAINLRSDSLIKELLESPIVDDIPLLNPVREVEGFAKISYKGPCGGIPLGHPKGTEEIRAFSDSMKGVYGAFSPNSSEVGLSRVMSFNSSVESIRGYIKSNKDKKLNATNTNSVGELLHPFTMNHADPVRQGMAVTQAGHQLATKKMHKALVTSGAHKAVSYLTGNDFCFKAFDDGYIEKIDKENELVHLKYKDGSFGIIDISQRNVRGPDGFYVVIKMDGDFRIGKKFKKGDILGADYRFFHNSGNETELMAGTLTKIALAQTDTTYEDSSVICRTLADNLEADIVYVSDVLLEPNATIINMVNIGDKIKTSEPLMSYESAFSDDPTITATAEKLAHLYDKESDLAETSHSKISKYTGIIVDIRIHYNRELSEYSPSIQKFISKYKKKFENRSKVLEQVRDDQVVDYRTTERNESGKYGGGIFDGIIIEFSIQTKGTFEVGDKLSYGVALKSVVGEILSKEKAPYSEFRPEENIDAILSPMSIVSRMTHDFFFQIWTNKILIELKHKVKEIYEK